MNTTRALQIDQATDDELLRQGQIDEALYEERRRQRLWSELHRMSNLQWLLCRYNPPDAAYLLYLHWRWPDIWHSEWERRHHHGTAPSHWNEPCQCDFCRNRRELLRPALPATDPSVLLRPVSEPGVTTPKELLRGV